MNVRDILPYYLVERGIRRRQGTWKLLQSDAETRLRRKPGNWLPYGLVRARELERLEAAREKRPSVGFSGVPASGFSDWDLVGRIKAARDDSAATLKEARVLVCLHFFYPDLWPVVRAYLENLSPYCWDLVVTYPEGIVPESSLAEIRAFRADVRFLACRNAGFDIGPFVEALYGIDLGLYDVVFKLQTKGCRRPLIYIYDQVFRGSDWLVNLYEGVLGGANVHRAVEELASGRAALCAAENLIVRDPKHKRAFVRRFCEERGLAYDDDYRFIAGTCFAVRAESLTPLQSLGLRLADFADTLRGEFTLAHALERWMCFAAAGRMKGLPVRRPIYSEDVAMLASMSAIRLLDDPRFDLDFDFFYRSLEMLPIRSYEVVEVRLGDIRRIWTDRRAYPLDELPPSRYLAGDVAGYEAYCSDNAVRTGYRMSRERFDALCESMADYDDRRMPVVLGDGNFIMDGQHRSCILLRKFGPDYRIRVVRIHP